MLTEQISYIVGDLKGLARPIELFELDPDNARTGHDVDGIAASLAKHGQRKPIVANGQGGPPFRITAGNGTWQAAVSLGWEYIAAVVVDETVGEATEYALVDNALAEASRWHPERLRAALARVPAGRPTGGGSTYSGNRVLELLRNRPVSAESRQLSPAAEQELKVQVSAENEDSSDSAVSGPKSAQRGVGTDSAEDETFGVTPGDLWRLPGGDDRNHWLFCGDCRDADVWRRFLSEWGFPPVQGVFTSPPYAEQRSGSYGGVSAADYVDWFTAVPMAALEFLAPDGSLFLNIKPHSADGGRDLYVLDLVMAMVRRWGWVWIDELAWNRQGFPGRYRNRFKNAHEPVYHFSRTPDCKFRPENVAEETDLSYAAEYSAENNTTMGPAYDGRTGRNVKAADGRALPTNVIKAYTGAHDPTAVTGHGATFPVQLPEFFLRAFSDSGDLWLDPFCGTGTMLVAAEQTRRIGLGIELLPEVCELALGRWARHMGRQPERVSTGVENNG